MGLCLYMVTIGEYQTFKEVTIGEYQTFKEVTIGEYQTFNKIAIADLPRGYVATILGKYVLGMC